jgi:uncharacterized membrane protein YecN with MAPEG domain
MEHRMNVFLVCSAILVLLYFVLAVNVSMARQRYRVSMGTGADAGVPLLRIVRAHGNAAEYIPLFVALFLYFLLSGAGGWIAWVAIGVTVSRLLHAIGMLTTARANGPPTILRVLGGAGTYVGGFMLGVALLMRAML